MRQVAVLLLFSAAACRPAAAPSLVQDQTNAPVTPPASTSDGGAPDSDAGPPDAGPGQLDGGSSGANPGSGIRPDGEWGPACGTAPSMTPRRSGSTRSCRRSSSATPATRRRTRLV